MASHNDQWLTDECRYYAKHYKYNQSRLEKGLEGFAAHLFVQEAGFNKLLGGEPTREVDLSEFICRSNDLGIDCVLEDEENNRIMLVQAAWRKKNLEEDKVGAFFDVVQRIRSGEYKKTGGEQIQDLLGGFNQQFDDGWQVILRFVTNGSMGANDKLQALVAAKQLAYEESGQNVLCELYGESELRLHKESLTSAIAGGLVGEVSLNFQDGKILEFAAPYRTIVAAIKGNELVNLFNKRGVGLHLFNLNVRLPLATMKVNKKIIDTASSNVDSSSFFYYNNGVSAVCSEYSLTGNTVTAKRFQVINGAQTVKALVTAYRDNPNNDVYVLFRLTETSDLYGGPFTENIIRYNNTQNPVTASDFFSNDPIQEWLRDNLRKISGKGPIPNFYYIFKAGYRPKGTTGSGIKMEEFAKLRHASLHGPVLSYRSPKDIFSGDKDKAIYWEAFGIDNKPVEAWPEAELYRAGCALALNQYILQIAKTLKGNEKTKYGDEAKYLARMARYVMSLVFVGLEAIKSDSFHDYQTLTASKATFKKHVDPILTGARDVLRNEYKRRKEERPGQQPEYNLARDAILWLRISDEVAEKAVADQVLI